MKVHDRCSCERQLWAQGIQAKFDRVAAFAVGHLGDAMPLVERMIRALDSEDVQAKIGDAVLKPLSNKLMPDFSRGFGT